MALRVGHLGRLRSSSRTLNADEQKTETAALLKKLHVQPESAEQDALNALSETAKALTRLLSGQSSSKDVFRHGNGFEKTIQCLQDARRLCAAKKDPPSTLVSLIRNLMLMLAEALRDHRGNDKYFRLHLDGWKAFNASLKSVQASILESLEDASRDSGALADLYDGLIDFAILRKQVEHESVPNGQQAAGTANGSTQTPLPPNVNVFNPNALTILTHLLLALLGEDEPAKHEIIMPVIDRNLRTITAITNASLRNSAVMWQSGLLSDILHTLFRPMLTGSSKSILDSLASSLGAFGLNDLEDLAFLFRTAATSDSAREYLLATLKKSKVPAFFQFDMMLRGYSAVEFPNLSRTFPPSAGYTLAAWIRIDDFDIDCHTTLFGAFDETQRCFVLLYLEKDSRQLILQTSISAPVPSVRFKTVRFKAGRWYHLALVHRKNATDPSQSVAYLLVDGDFREHRKCFYPEAPEVKSSHHGSASSSQTRPPPVQAFFGTPQKLATVVAPNRTRSRWSLASAHIFLSPLSDEFLAVQYRLGPRYHGNLQDCLGPLLTYRASSELNLRNDQIHPDKSEKSDIVTVTEGKGSDLISEAHLLLGIDPTAVIDFDSRLTGCQTVKYELDHTAYARYQMLSQKSQAIALNTAVASINEAVSRSYGTGLILGDPVIVTPQPLDDGLWCLSGPVPALFQLLESANSQKAFLQATEVLLECVKDNWRISEAMEKGHGFGVLAIMIREKLGFEIGPSSQATTKRPSPMLSPEDRRTLPLPLLRMILDFVGHSETAPGNSLLINPMAYRVLVVDFDTWRRCDMETQKLYWDQFVHFVSENKNHHFNQKRLIRMRIVKRLIEALKTEEVFDDAATLIMASLKSLSDTSSAHNLYRDLAQFVAFGLHDERALPLSSLRNLASVVSFRQKAGSWARSVRSPRPGTPGGHQSQSGKIGLSRFELAVLVLRLLTDAVCNDKTGTTIRRLTRAVPSRWLLHLLAETDVRVVELTLNIISKAIITLGADFKAPFVDPDGGFVTLKFRLKPFWQSTPAWTICFATFFGKSVPLAWLAEEFSAFHLVEMLSVDDSLVIANSEMLSVIFAMLEAGLRKVAKDETPNDQEAKILKTVIQFLNECYDRSVAFREFAATSRYSQELLFVLFPVLAGTDRLSAETELQSERETLSFNGQEVTMRPHSSSLNERPPSVRSLNVDDSGKRTPSPMAANRVDAPRRVSSFILVNDRLNVPPAQFNAPMSPKHAEPLKIDVTNSIVESLLELAIGFFIDQVCNKPTFNGIGLFLKVPPGFREHQAYFESYVLVHALSQLSSHLRLHQGLLAETRVLGNLSRFTQHMSEAVSEGWFIDGAQPLLDFVGEILDHLQQPEIASLKTVRLCSQSINAMRVVFLKATLWRMSELNEDADEKQVSQFLTKMTYWQTILFSSDNHETLFTRLICYLLYHKLVSSVKSVRLAAVQLWRIVLVQKPTETATLLSNTMGHDNRHLSTGFMKLVSMDDGDFLTWIDENRADLDAAFNGSLGKPWDEFVQSENRISEESNRSRIQKRREKLRQWQAEEATADDVIHRYEISTNHWRANIHAQERSKLQRSIQDHQENINHLHMTFTKIDRLLQQPSGLAPVEVNRWRLDDTESVNRMRMRVIPDNSETKDIFQPKRKFTERHPDGRASLAINTQIPKLVADDGGTPTPPPPGTSGAMNIDGSTETPNQEGERGDSISNSQLLEGGFEMVEDPKEDEDGLIEDKNRKVMTSLQRGDMVQQLHNISRIIGLEACEGLLVIGQKCLYMQDNFFQRSDGEIVGVSQAPRDERDPYVQLISGQDVGAQQTKHSIGDQETRHWTWSEVLSVSKRRFLFRDVSIEVFFSDGRSYLLTCMSAKARDDLYNAIVQRAPHVYGSSGVASEDAWRLDTLRIPEEGPQSLGTRFGGLFNSNPTHTATKKWTRGEMSNFQYLMLINTMAGRTFNDLTQYPVFPWVLADYSSDELNLEDPKSFRDLSKPMGCQTPGREAEYHDRYRQFAEMADHNAPPFHYGTHYSSAMIVSSYLIRMQPFVQSYLLLQGGAFDHADRLFDSIEKAWLSASRDNRSDVRELTPEFFYLPEFLTNINKYDFGTKQVTLEAVNDVHLPKWAKGNPHTFIAKHREALESPYVSQHLHEWIDLVFGFKQRGEAAIEATNVFQHLSYGGAKDLDKIQDQVERLATIGIIHSFGQTPYQVFQKPHLSRELDRSAIPKLDSLAGTLTLLADPMLETGEKVTDFTHSLTQDRLLASGPCRLNVPPNCDRFMQWGFADNSIRFFSTHSKRLLGLYENTHIGPVSAATFVDSKNLVTAGIDCTVGVWKVSANKDTIDIQPKAYLFGHRKAVTVLAASRVFSILLSASTDGHVLLWGLNRYNCIRALLPAGGLPIQAARISNVSGHILLCRGARAFVYTLNGHLLVKQRVCDRDDETITCCAFYEGVGNEYLERELIFTGHAHGITNVWALVTLDDGSWCLQLVKRMMTSPDPNRAAAITAVLPMPKAVYTGDEEGNVWDWECVQRHTSSRGGLF